MQACLVFAYVFPISCLCVNGESGKCGQRFAYVLLVSFFAEISFMAVMRLRVQNGRLPCGSMRVPWSGKAA